MTWRSCLLAGVLLVASVSGARAQSLPTPGQLDSTFNPGPLTVRGDVANWMFLYAVAIQPDGKIIVGGDFDQVGFVDRPVIARFHPDGSLDSSFNTPLRQSANDSLYAAAYDVAVQSDGRILVAGEFIVNGEPRYLVRLNPDGSLDGSFHANVNALIYRVVLQPDGKIIIGSNSLQTVDGVGVNYLARLNPDGSLETPLGAIGGAGSVFAIALQPDGKIVVAGSFYLLRMNGDGSFDPTFNPSDVGPNTVYAVALQRDGKVLYGGSRTYTGGGPFLLRANADGSPDPTFAPVVDFGSVIWTIHVESDGKILIGGEFGRVNGIRHGNYARLKQDGSVDPFFPEPYDGADWNVEDIAVDQNGHVVIVGSFQYFYDDVLPNEYRTGIARLFDTKYRLSSSPDGNGAIVVDDDLDVYVNGFLIYTDGTAAAGARAPIRFSGAPGDQIRLVVRDTYGNCASLSPIFLIDPVGTATPLDPGFSLGCGRPVPTDPVFDKTFSVPAANAGNRAPAASSGSAQTDEDTAVAIDLIATDPENDPLTYTIVTGPGFGTLSGTAPNLIYTPAPNFNGADSFTFRVSDGPADSNVATINITVNPIADTPVAIAQPVATLEETPVGINLTGADPDGGTLAFAVASAPLHGTLSGTAPALTYTPDADYFGSDSFTFTVGDGTTTSGPATVTISIANVNDAPIAAGQNVTTPSNTALPIALSASDADNDLLTYEIVAAPAHGTLSGTGPGVTYTPAANYSGPDSFTFRVKDALVSSNVATVTIAVTSNVVATSTSLSSSRNPSAAGEPVTFTATVSGGAPPTGAVTFFVDGAPASPAVPLSGTTASFTTSALTAGGRGITAQYSGDANHASSTSASLTQQVSKAVTTTTLTAQPSPSQPTDAVLLTATISGFNPGGLVTFLDGNQVVGTGMAANGVATLTTTHLKKGKRQLSAVYAGDANNLSSASDKIRHTVK